MRVLVLGGTAFVGRAIVTDALQRGMDVTLFGRGRTGTELFPDTPRLIGDRETGDYEALANGEWDAVVDVSGYVPRHVTQAMDAVGDRGGRYVFISSQAAYEQRDVPPGTDESAPLQAPERSGVEELNGDTYGPLKVACEEDVLDRFGDKAAIVRPGRVVGPHESQGMFTYWVRRVTRGGRVALPGRPEQPIQVIDVRDLARLVMILLTDDRSGVYNAVGPAMSTTLGELIETCADAAHTRVEIVPVPPETAPPGIFPLVRADDAWGTQQRSAARARAAGMPGTPLTVTATDVLAWDRERGQPPLDVGFTPEDEQKVLKAHRWA